MSGSTGLIGAARIGLLQAPGGPPVPADWGKRHKLRAALAASSSRDGGVKSAAKTGVPSWSDRLSSKTVVSKGADGESTVPHAQAVSSARLPPTPSPPKIDGATSKDTQAKPQDSITQRRLPGWLRAGAESGGGGRGASVTGASSFADAHTAVQPRASGMPTSGIALEASNPESLAWGGWPEGASAGGVRRCGLCRQPGLPLLDLVYPAWRVIAFSKPQGALSARRGAARRELIERRGASGDAPRKHPGIITMTASLASSPSQLPSCTGAWEQAPFVVAGLYCARQSGFLQPFVFLLAILAQIP